MDYVPEAVLSWHGGDAHLAHARGSPQGSCSRSPPPLKTRSPRASPRGRPSSTLRWPTTWTSPPSSRTASPMRFDEPASLKDEEVNAEERSHGRPPLAGAGVGTNSSRRASAGASAAHVSGERRSQSPPTWKPSPPRSQRRTTVGVLQTATPVSFAAAPISTRSVAGVSSSVSPRTSSARPVRPTHACDPGHDASPMVAARARAGSRPCSARARSPRKPLVTAAEPPLASTVVAAAAAPTGAPTKDPPAPQAKRIAYDYRYASRRAPLQTLLEAQRLLALHRVTSRREGAHLLRCEGQGLRFDVEVLPDGGPSPATCTVSFRRSSGSLLAFRELCARVGPGLLI